MLPNITRTLTRINQIDAAWHQWSAAVQSRIYPPFPSPELDDQNAPRVLRWAWRSARTKTLAQLRSSLPPEDYQEALAQAGSRTHDLAAVGEREAVPAPA